MESTVVKPSLKELLDPMVLEFEQMITEFSAEWHDLDKYRGMQFVDEEGNDINKAEFEEVNLILNNLQALFHEIFPILHFINGRATFAKNMVDQYNTLMQKLVEGGAETYQTDQTVN